MYKSGLFLAFLFLINLNAKAQVTHPIENTGPDALKTFIENTSNWAPGDTILLVSAGEYRVNGPIQITQSIAIKGDPALKNDQRPLITFFGASGGFQPRANDLTMTFLGFDAKGLTLDEKGDPQRAALLRFGRRSENGAFSNSIIKFEDIRASGFSTGIELFYEQGLRYKSITIRNVIWHDISGWVLDPRINATDEIRITNSTFYNIGGFLRNPYFTNPDRTLRIPQRIIISRNTIYRVASGEEGVDALIQINDPKDGQVSLTFNNNIVSTLINPATARPFRLDPLAGVFSFSNNVLHNFNSPRDDGRYNLSSIDAAQANVVTSNILNVDPEFADPAAGDFTLPENSALLTSGTTGGAVGDPRWSGGSDDDDEEEEEVLVSQILVAGQGGKSAITVKGGYLGMVATVLPGTATNRNIIWSINNEQLAAIDQNGGLVAKASGVVTVTATATDGSGVTGSVDVTISNQSNITSITVAAEDGRTTLGDGESVQMVATLTPADPDNPQVIWGVDDARIASISEDGVLTAVAGGVVTVTAYAEENRFMFGTTKVTIQSPNSPVGEPAPANSQPIAFPGAEGFGKHATGGRGGRVVEVTNLLDQNQSGQPEPGSFRAALNTPGTDPITVVFRVSGIVKLNAELKSNRSNMTIAGQTAPGDGICIKDNTVALSGSNLIIRYVRFRPGDETGVQTTPLNIENARHIMVDHCSFSWAVEENMGMYDNHYTTVQWSILSEGLHNSVHGKGARSYGSQWGGQYASYHHNLLAHHRSRSPRINGSRSNDTVALVDFRNNVIFNWGSRGAVYGGEEEIRGGESKVNFVNNYYKPGPATPGTRLFAEPSYVTEGNTAMGHAKWYFDGNYMEGVTGGMNNDNWLGVDAGRVGGTDNIRHQYWFPVDPVQTHSAQEAYSLVLENAGAILPKRDAVDARIVAETRGDVPVRGNGIIDAASEVGGWPNYNSTAAPTDSDKDGMPDAWELAHNLDPGDAEDGKIIVEGGYSNLEIYLNSLVPGLVTSSGEMLAAGFEMYPNPASDRVFFSSTEKLLKVELYDLSGRLVLAKTDFDPAQDNHIGVGHLRAGFYVMRSFFRNGHTAERKLMKQ